MKKKYFYKVSQQYDADIEQIRRENRVLCTTAPRLANNTFLARIVKIQGTKKLEGEKLKIVWAGFAIPRANSVENSSGSDQISLFPVSAKLKFEKVTKWWPFLV